MHKSKKLLKETMSRKVYNIARKFWLEHDGQIYCSYCKYHRGENCTKKYYGGDTHFGVRYPSWKLASKNKKQWMKKDISIEVETRRLYRWISNSKIVDHYEINLLKRQY